MQFLGVHNNLKMCKIVKSERQKTVFCSTKLKLIVYLLEIYIFGPFWEDVSGEIKAGPIKNLPIIYQNFIYVVKFCHQF
jgi:hypothetical protein